MFLVLKLLYKELEMAESTFYRDARVSHLPLVGSPLPMILILVLYLLFVKKWGPKFMENRKPYDLKLVIQITNVLQVVLNSYIFCNSLRYTYLKPHFSWTCQEYNPLDTRSDFMNFRCSAYLYYISKYLDLLDTVFFVLRKKDKQISFLHVYHHSMMIVGVWVYFTLLFASHATFPGVVNSLIHVLMYSYYFVAALKLKIDLTKWKRTMTQLQILQFLFVTVHLGLPICNNWCGVDLFWIWAAFVQNLFLLILFLDFYFRAYVFKSKRYAQNPNVSAKVKTK